jgi:hypothetical protein
MNTKLLLVTTLLIATIVPRAQARDRIKLETTIIKGNKEMPQIVYIVPWKDMKDHNQTEQTLVLHSLFGDLFNPVHEAGIQPRVNVSAKLKVSDSRN